MVSYIKRTMNTEFKDCLDLYKGCSGSDWFDPEYDREEDEFDFKTYKKFVKQEVGEVDNEYWTQFEYYEYDMNYKKINVDMIKNIERDTILDVVVRPIQQKIKEILYNPHTKRGRAFAFKNIEWAFE